jgi:hypothetical protein
MGRSCTVCRHPERAQIDRRLVAGDPAAMISSDFVGLGERAVQRHRNDHLPAVLLKAEAASEAARGDRLLADLKDLHQRTLTILGQAEQAADHATALRAIQQARGNLELLSRLLGQIGSETTVNVVTEVQYRILGASGELIEESRAD